MSRLTCPACDATFREESLPQAHGITFVSRPVGELLACECGEAFCIWILPRDEDWTPLAKAEPTYPGPRWFLFKDGRTESSVRATSPAWKDSAP